MDRRNFLSAALSIGAATPAAAFVGPAPEAPEAPSVPDWWKRLTAQNNDPVVRLVDEWRRTQSEWRDVDEDSEEFDRIGDRVETLAEQIAQTVPTTRAGQIAQIEWMRDDLGDYVNGMIGSAYQGVFEVMIAGVKAVA